MYTISTIVYLHEKGRFLSTMSCHIICFVSFRYVSFLFVSLRFDLFRFIPICFVSFRFVSFRFDRFRFVPFRFCFVSHFTGTHILPMHIRISMSGFVGQYP